VRNHALIDVNNRIGCLAAVVFYGLNDIALEAPDDDAYDLVIGVASGDCVRRRGRPADQVAQSHYGRCGRSRGNARTGADEIAAVPPEATVRGAADQGVCVAVPVGGWRPLRRVRIKRTRRSWDWNLHPSGGIGIAGPRVPAAFAGHVGPRVA